ncbi:MAG TPA: hypothetical protein VLJ88_18235 [Propionibacteriaceae bacterium]|nr:hypothetical protein [Propionibacteriaceae bacterium]
MIVPAAACAVLAIVGAVVVAETWTSGTPAPHVAKPMPNPPQVEGKCWDEQPFPKPAEAPELLHLIPTPSGMTLYPELDAEIACSDHTHPLVTFLKRAATGPEGTLSAALTVTALDGSPQEIAELEVLDNLSPGEDPKSARIRLPKSTPITVRGRPGLLIKQRVLEWQEPGGQWWRVTGSGLTSDQLVVLAAGLTLDRDTMTWPTAAQQGFEALPIPALPQGKTVHRWLNLYYTEPGLDLESVVVSVGLEQPWQLLISGMKMPVRLLDVNGQAGVLTENGTLWDMNVPMHDAKTNKSLTQQQINALPSRPLVLLETKNGQQVNISGRVSAPELLAVAEQLKVASADDPRLAHANDPPDHR